MKKIKEKDLNNIISESIKKVLNEDDSILGAAKEMNRALKNMGATIHNPADDYDVNLSEISQKLYKTAESLKEINEYLNGVESDIEGECTKGVAHNAQMKYMWQDEDEDYDLGEKRELANDLSKIGRTIDSLITRLNETAEWAESLSPEYKEQMRKERWGK